MTPPKNDERSYAAFISYRHLPLDREAAIRIQKRIESFVVPREYRNRTGGKKLGLCFRDEDELPASASLSGSIKYALDHSKFLIVICTPQLQFSQWCMAEIQYFLQTHDRNHVLAVLADGRPEQSFPDMLRFIRDFNGNILANVEPLAANISSPDHKINKKSFKKESLRLCAAILGCPFDALWQREHRARANRTLMAMTAGFAVMAVIVGVVLVKNAQISEKNRQLEKNLSTALVDTGIARLEEYDLYGALDDALNAVGSEDPEIYDHRVEKLLNDALGAYLPGKVLCTPMAMQPTDIESLCASENGRIGFSADQVGNILAMDMTKGEVLWNVSLKTTGSPSLYAVGNDLLLCKYPEKLTALSMENGSIRWTYEYHLPNEFQVISDDGRLFAVLDWNMSLEDMTAMLKPGEEDKASVRPESAVDMEIDVLDTTSGELAYRYLLPEESYHIYIDPDDKIYDCSGDFSDDNTALTFALPALMEQGRGVMLIQGTYDSGYQLSVIDELQTQPDMILGVETSVDKSSVYWALTKGKSLYSIIVYANQEEEPITQKIDYSLSSPNGTDSDYYHQERPYLPMLTSENHVVLTSRNTIYLIDRKEGTLRYYMTLESPVVSAIWENRNEEKLEILTRNGHLVTYQLAYGGEEAFRGCYYWDVPVEDISAVYRSYHQTGDIYGDYILVSSDVQPGYMLVLNVGYDKDYKSVPVESSTNCAYAQPTPSGDQMMFFFPDRQDETVVHVKTIDIRTGTIQEEAAVSLAPFGFWQQEQSLRPLPTDNSHFLLYGRIYGLDGSVTEINPDPEDDQKYLAAVLQDGQLLYICRTEPTGQSIPSFPTGSEIIWTAPDCYLNGRQMEECSSIEDGIAMQYSSYDNFTGHYTVGSNGWIAGWGNALMLEEVSAATEYMPGFYKTVVSENMVIAAKNIKTGYKVEIRDEAEGVEVTHMVLSNTKPYLAAAYEQGSLGLYDLRLEKGYLLTDTVLYARGEIQELCFSDSDRYLLVLTVNGRVDCYDVETREKVFSLSHAFGESSEDRIDRFFALEEAENNRLVLIAANESGKTDYDSYRAKYWTTVLDIDSWAVTLQTDDICWWSDKHDQAVIASGTVIGTCTIHTLKDLTEWARSVKD